MEKLQNYQYKTEQKAQIIYLLGGPGSGKGTQCDRLVRDFNFLHISVGDIMRNEMKNQTEIGKQCEQYVQNGSMVPSKLTVDLILKTLDEVTKTNKKILLDGFPRNLEQGIILEQKFEEIDFILNFTCDEELLFQRLIKRSGYIFIYQLGFQERMDDNEETIRKRIEDFNIQTKEALSFYQNFGKVVNIDANGTVEEVYEQVLKALLPNVIFFYGAPSLGKSAVAESLAKRMFYKYINLQKFYEEFLCTTNEDKVNVLMGFYYWVVLYFVDYLRNSPERNFIIDDFFETIQQTTVFFAHFGKPKNIFYFDATKDQIDSNIFNYIEPCKRNAVKKKYELFTMTRKEIMAKLQQNQILTKINYSETLNQLEQQILKCLQPKIMIAYNQDNPELYTQCLQYLIDNYNFTEIDFKQQLMKELDRGTQLGQIISTFTCQDKPPDLNTQLALLRKIIFRNHLQNQFIITGFGSTIEECKVFENECCKIDFGVSVLLEGQKIEYENQFEKTVESYLRSSGRHFVIDKEELELFDSYLAPKSKFGFIIGAPGTGKTTIAKELETIFGFHLIDYEKVQTMLKEKLGGQDGPLDELTFVQLTTYFKQLINEAPRWQVTVFDGFPFEMKDMIELINSLGHPNFIVYLNVSKETATAAYKRKNELEAAAELGDDDLEKLETYTKPAEALKGFFEELAQKSFYLNFYDVNANNKLNKISSDIQRVFYKRVIACNLNVTGLKSEKCWESYSTLLCNVCTKLQIGFVDIRKLITDEFQNNGPLKEELNAQLKMRWTDTPANFASNYSPKLIINLLKNYFQRFIEFGRDVFVFGFPSGDNFQERTAEEQFFPRILDETTLIEEQVGPIRIALLITDNFQQSVYDDPIQEIMKLDMPTEKKEPIYGEDGEEIVDEEEKKEDEDEDDEEKKKKFNPAEYTWTISDGVPKNFSQILHKKYVFCDEEITLEENSLDVFENVIAKYLNNLNDGAQENYFVQFLNCIQN